MIMVQQEQGTPHFILDKIIPLLSASAQGNRLASPCVADFLSFPAFLCQFSPVKQETDDLAVFFRLIPQALAVISVRLAQLFCYAVCLRCDDTHLTVCRVIAVLLPIPLSLFLQQVPLSVIEVSERVRAALEMGELVLCIVVIDFRALCGFLFSGRLIL